MYCSYCGREERNDHCTCLATNPISKIETYILFLLVISVPVLIYSRYVLLSSIDPGRFYYVGSTFLSILLLIMTLAEWIFKRPYLALFFGCHQKTSRTLSLFHNPLPLCARCTGIYLGVFTTFIVTSFISIPFYIFLILGIPLIVDGLLQKYKNIVSTNPRRFITGLLFGFTFVYIFSLYNYYLVLGLYILTNLFM